MPSSHTTIQNNAFLGATDASQQIGPSVRNALTYVSRAQSRIGSVKSDITSARTQIREAKDTADKMRDIEASLRGFGLSFGVSPLLDDFYTLYNLFEAYNTDFIRIDSALPPIERSLGRMTFQYRDTRATRYTVRTCTNLRRFKGYYSASGPGLGTIYRSVAAIKDTIGFYGTRAGKQRRRQTTDMIVRCIQYANRIESILTNLMRGLFDNTLRPLINALGDRGVELAWPLLKFTAQQQGRGQSNFKAHWRRSNRSSQLRFIRTALDVVRGKVRGVRRRTLPNARRKFVQAFSGMAEVEGQTSSRFTPSQIASFGPAAQGYLQIVDAANMVRRATAKRSTSPAVPSPSFVQCEIGSGYAGLFSDDEGEEMSPLVVIGGSLLVGAALAHFLPSLLGR